VIEGASGIAGALAAMVMALTFVFGGAIHPFRWLARDRRSLMSFGAGVAAAYLFVAMMPELAEAMVTLNEANGSRGNAGLLVYVMALLGFVVFYGLNHWTRTGPAARAAEGPEASEGRVYGHGLYVWIMSYVMVAEASGSIAATLWYAVAISFHFLTIDHSLSEKRGRLYERRGRYLLAGCVALGWLCAQILDLSPTTTSLALGFVSGALTVNSALMELSEGTQGRFAPFGLGCVRYAALFLGVGLLT
jgi:hypothetical protein